MSALHARVSQASRAFAPRLALAGRPSARARAVTGEVIAVGGWELEAFGLRAPGASTDRLIASDGWAGSGPETLADGFVSRGMGASFLVDLSAEGISGSVSAYLHNPEESGSIRCQAEIHFRALQPIRLRFAHCASSSTGDLMNPWVEVGGGGKGKGHCFEEPGTWEIDLEPGLHTMRLGLDGWNDPITGEFLASSLSFETISPARPQAGRRGSHNHRDLHLT